MKLPLELIATILGFINNYKLFFLIRNKALYKPMYIKIMLDNTTNECKKSILTEACKKNHITYINLISKYYGLHPSLQDYYITAEKGYIDLFKQLSKLDIYYEIHPDYNVLTTFIHNVHNIYNKALFYAVKGNSYEIAKFILETDLNDYPSAKVAKIEMFNKEEWFKYDCYKTESVRYKVLFNIIHTNKMELFKLICRHIPIDLHWLTIRYITKKHHHFLEYILSINRDEHPMLHTNLYFNRSY